MGVSKKLMAKVSAGRRSLDLPGPGVSAAGYEGQARKLCGRRWWSLLARIEASLEIEALLNGWLGGYIEPGPIRSHHPWRR